MGETVLQYLVVGMGGFLGAIARYYLSSFMVRKWPTAYPIGTFTVNIFGSFLLGLFITINNQLTINANLNWGVTIGFLGAFTTFATFSYELIKLVEENKKLVATFYLFNSIIIGILAVAMGYWVGKIIIS